MWRCGNEKTMMNEELGKILKDAGAALVGFGDMTSVNGCSWPVGVCVAVRLPTHIVVDLLEAPTAEYGQAYTKLNNQLNEIVRAGAAFLQENGYHAIAQSTDNVSMLDPITAVVPHKTVATRAGLGWIGKSCLLVTPEYGSAVRISSILTDAPLRTNEPIVESRCGKCTSCVDHCPAQALKGTLWHAGMPRAEIVDAPRCDDVMHQIVADIPNLNQAVCGKCIAVCPYTKRGLRC